VWRVVKEDREYLAAGGQYPPVNSSRVVAPSVYLAELAWKRWKAGQVDNPATLSPIYLHYNNPIRYEVQLRADDNNNLDSSYAGGRS